MSKNLEAIKIIEETKKLKEMIKNFRELKKFINKRHISKKTSCKWDTYPKAYKYI